MRSEDAKKTVFMERSNVLHEYYEGKTALQDVKFYPHASDSLRSLALMEYLVVILHNGISEIGRPVMQMLSRQIEQKIRRSAAARFIFGSCFHLPEDKCDCRMPNTAMIEKVVKQYELDLAGSVFVAGSTAGVKAAEKAGIGTVMLLKTGVKRKPRGSKIKHFGDLSKAVDWLKENAP